MCSLFSWQHGISYLLNYSITVHLKLSSKKNRKNNHLNYFELRKKKNQLNYFEFKIIFFVFVFKLCSYCSLYLTLLFFYRDSFCIKFHPSIDIRPCRPSAKVIFVLQVSSFTRYPSFTRYSSLSSFSVMLSVSAPHNLRFSGLNSFSHTFNEYVRTAFLK
jgi:hypothetical protein